MLLLFLIVSVGLVASSEYFEDSARGNEHESNLIANLFEKQGYNPLIRPVHNLNQSLIVNFNVALIQIINIDEKNQILSSNVWLRSKWKDYQLTWDPYDYGGVSVFRIASSQVWKPDIVLYNNADGRYEVSYKSNVVLSHTGDVSWVTPAIYKSSCIINVEYFPFDEQECKLKFGSWAFNGNQVRLDWYDKTKRIDLTDYVQSASWNIMACPGQLFLEFDQADLQNKSYVVYTLKIRRKPLFYTTNLIIPCILISLLSVCVFYLPSDALEKMTLCISILLAMTFFLLLISKILPPTSLTVSLIAKYLLFTFMMNLIAIFCTITIINWNFRISRSHPMSPWIRSVMLNFLPRIIFMKRPNHDQRFGSRGAVKSELNDAVFNVDNFQQPPSFNTCGRTGEYQVNNEERNKSKAKRVNEKLKKVHKKNVANDFKPTFEEHNNTFINETKDRKSSLYVKNIVKNKYKRDVNLNKTLRNTNLHRTKTQYINTMNTKPHNIEAEIQKNTKAPRNHTENHYEPSQLIHRLNNKEALDNMKHKKYHTNFREKVNIPVCGNTLRAVKAIKFVASHLKNEQEITEMMSDWRYMALVIDRLLLYIFFSVIVFGAISILINAPYIFDHVDQESVIRKILNHQHGISHLSGYRS